MQQRSLRVIIALLLVLGFVSVAAASVSPGHLHGTQKAHSCSLCQVSLAQLPAASAILSIWPPEGGSHHLLAETASFYAGRSILCQTSRGPPQE